MRLDTPSGLFGEGNAKGAVVPGSLSDSQLIERILATDDKIMPPVSSAKKLRPEEIERLSRWVKEGATYEGHWAFQPIQVPKLPEQAVGVLPVANEIDRFLNRAIAENRLTIADEADRRTLIRRLSFDLIGLPPTPEEVEAFVKDTRPNAYELLVDRLLESEHYGEKMAIGWLDLVRYADTVGYHGDQPMSVSPFRDYIIQSFNQNRPFDQFTIEQLAGDLLANPTQSQQIAAGYNRLGMMSAEGGVQDKEYLAKYIAERVRNVGGTWLGVTLGCCECHDHKYDPFSTKDFYRFEAFFADIEEKGLYSGANASGEWGPSFKVMTSEQRRRLEELDRDIAEQKEKLVAPNQELDQDQAKWESLLPNWKMVRPLAATAKHGTVLTIKEDDSILASGETPDRDAYEFELNGLPTGANALRIEVLPDASLPQKGPGRAGNGNFVLSEIKVLKADGEMLELESASASFEQTEASKGNPYNKWAVAAAIDRDAKGAKWGWGILGQTGRPNHAVFLLKEGTTFESGQTYRIILEQNLDNPKHTIGRLRIAVTTAIKPSAIPGVDETTWTALAKEASQRNDNERKAIANFYRSTAPRLEPIRKELAEKEAERKKYEASIPSMLATKSVAPRMVRVLARGNWMDEQGEIVKPAFPDVLPTEYAKSTLAKQKDLNRLDLAKWLVSPDHPLTSRVLVNRLWKQFYGTGLSRRLDDFGSQGEPPSHPELLDWLARRMIDSKWDVKGMVRLMVTSAAYRRDSKVESTMASIDPTNRWYARQNRFRLDAELVRDNALAASGLLVRKVGGVSVKPYQPPGYWAYLNFPQREWANGIGEELYRRGLYTHWQRQYLHPSLMTFDAPSREECTAERMRSNTPLQSLVLLNDPSYVEAARGLAAHAMSSVKETKERMQWMAQRTLSRKLTSEELEVLERLHAKHLEEMAQDASAVDRLLKVGALPTPSELDRVQLAAWTSIARTMLNLHETITRP